MTKGEIAENYFLGGCNCAQAVALAFAEDCGCDEGFILRAASAFGGGMCRMREVCGALSGAMLVLGLMYGEGSEREHDVKKALYARGQEIFADFKGEMGSCICRELLSPAEGSGNAPDKREGDYYKRRPCSKIVRLAADILADKIREN